MVDATAVERQGEEIKRSAEGREYRWRAYMSSGLTNVEGPDFLALKALMQSLFIEVFGPLDVFLYLPHLWSSPEGHAAKMSPEDVNVLDRMRLAQSDFLVVCANHPSFGVGQEFEIAQSLGLPALVFAEEAQKVSRMLTGGAAIRVVPGESPSKPSGGVIRYNSLDELCRVLGQRTAELQSIIEPGLRTEVVFGEKLTSVMRAKNLSPELLSKRTGLSIAFIDMLLTSHKDLESLLQRNQLPTLGTTTNLGRFANPGIWVLSLLANALEVEASELFEVKVTADEALALAASEEVLRIARRWLTQHGLIEKLPAVSARIDNLTTPHLVAARSMSPDEQSQFFQELLDELEDG